MKHVGFVSLIRMSVLFAAATLLAACGGGSGSSSDAGTGNVAVLLTDAPAPAFDEVNVRVLKAELLGDSGRVTLFEGDRTFNLLALTDAHLFAIRNDVPAGRYNKLRLTLAELELVRRDADGAVVETAYPSIPGNGKLDLLARGGLLVVPGETLVVQIDMDAGKSIHIVGTGSGKYQFRPVVFLDVLSDRFAGRFVRLHGSIDAIDAAAREFMLCDDRIPVRLDDSDDDAGNRTCIEVSVGSGTAIFGEDGLPAAFDDLAQGDFATVYGRLQRDDDGSGDGDHELADLELLAAVIELGPDGTFARLAGVADTPVDADGLFTMTLDPLQGFAAGSQLAVQMQDGTAVIDRAGAALDPDEIGPGVALRVDGVLDLAGDTAVLNAALVMVDTAARQQRLSGTVGANPDGSCGLTLITGDGDRSVRITGTTGIYEVTATPSLGSSALMTAAGLEAGQAVDIYGAQAIDGCFEADTVIAYRLEAPS